ncbi:MAG: GlsB/YeaQ/YmgE family stress response membrane protein [Sphingomonadaceae bacterium]|nr:GlsB/YeaQ/YmgE family stress response membrane protein [Sphingomonadaceae bacterium]
MNLLIILLIGAVVGWLAGMITGRGGGIVFNIIIGIIGAVVAGFLFGGGASIINAPLNVTSIALSTLGAVILMVIVSLVRGRRAAL